MSVVVREPVLATTRVLLRDGSSAGLRPSSEADRDEVRRFFAALSPSSRRLRFLATASPSEELLGRLCDNSDPHNGITLVVVRHGDHGQHIIGMGSYFATAGTSAEVAFAVDDLFHGKGIATAVLERLARIGREQGFDTFSATVLPENFDMLDVFRDSGFDVHAARDQATVEVQLSLAPSPAAIAASDERDRRATIASLTAILKPKAVAVVGASRRPANLGRRALESLCGSGFAGPIYAVNPVAADLDGRRCYRSMRDVPSGVDLAIIAVPRDAVLPVIDECATAGVKGVIVISAGFAEADAEGAALQSELVERVRGYGMRLVGPNCMGVINTDPQVRLNASFADQMPAAGRLALASQSGGLGLAILELARRRGLGLSTFVSLGNKADISGNDLLQYGEQDEATSVLLLYLESFGNPRRFGQLARRISRKKPIVVVKAGRTTAGLRAAASHTAGLAASERTVDGLFQQAGVIRADTIDELFDIAACLDLQPLPRGNRVGIVTNAGGPGILAADACLAASLDVPATCGGSVNPRDLIASAGAGAYREALASMLASDDVDAIVVIYTTIDRTQTTAILESITDAIELGRRQGFTQKPVLVCMMAAADTPHLRAGAETVPVFQFPEQAARALGKAATYARWRMAPEGVFPPFDSMRMGDARALCRQIAVHRGDTWLTPEELRQLMSAADLRLTPGVLAHSADEATSLARVFGFPVAAKIVSSKAIHKTEVGGVRLHLTSADAVRRAVEELLVVVRERLGGACEGILIQPMISGGTEALVGLSHDQIFGPLVAFGLGGINVELLGDAAFRIAPLTDCDADALIRSIRGFPLLAGYRDRQPADVRALRDVLLKVSYLGSQIPELMELEFNPVIALPEGQGCQIVDVRARVAPLRRLV